MKLMGQLFQINFATAVGLFIVMPDPETITMAMFIMGFLGKGLLVLSGILANFYTIKKNRKP